MMPIPLIAVSIVFSAKYVTCTTLSGDSEMNSALLTDYAMITQLLHKDLVS